MVKKYVCKFEFDDRASDMLFYELKFKYVTYSRRKRLICFVWIWKKKQEDEMGHAQKMYTNEYELMTCIENSILITSKMETYKFLYWRKFKFLLLPILFQNRKYGIWNEFFPRQTTRFLLLDVLCLKFVLWFTSVFRFFRHAQTIHNTYFHTNDTTTKHFNS